MEETVGDPHAGPGVIESNGDTDKWDAMVENMSDDECVEEEAEAVSLENGPIAAGTHHDAAKGFVKSIMPGTFVELYGKGTIVQETNKPRRSVNAEVLDAFDHRTTTPMGDP